MSNAFHGLCVEHVKGEEACVMESMSQPIKRSHVTDDESEEDEDEMDSDGDSFCCETSVQAVTS